MKREKIKNITWNTLKKLANLNFSIFLLLLIAGLSTIGTFIEQRRDVDFYQSSYPLNNSIFNWETVIQLGLDHIYSTWWFILVIVLFFLSLFICTLSTQLPILNNARAWKFLNQSNQVNHIAKINVEYNNSLSNMIFSLNQRNYYVFHKKNSIYAYKGLLGRISPIFVHISIILILLGAILGLCFGFTAQEIVPSHEIFHIDNMINIGVGSFLPANINIKINDFFILYYNDGSIKQFISKISLVNNLGIQLISKDISVNHPLKFKGLTIYQTDWIVNSLRFKIGESLILQKKMNKMVLNNRNCWICIIPTTMNQQIIVLVRDLKTGIEYYDSSGEFIAKCNLNEAIIINNTSYLFSNIIVSTGLQIKTDPGILIVYIGFVILIISIITSYISYSQIWVAEKNNSLVLYGFTNRAALSFEQDCISVQKIYSTYTNTLLEL